MGAHFAQKIVEIEDTGVPKQARDSLSASVQAMEFNHLNESANPEGLD
mgnify:CR=1 FL=1